MLADGGVEMNQNEMLMGTCGKQHVFDSCKIVNEMGQAPSVNNITTPATWGYSGLVTIEDEMMLPKT